MVLLSRDPETFARALKGIDRDRVEVVVVHSAPQAAAELCLIDPALLVVDLRQVGLRTAPLVAQARRQAVRVVAVGPLPFGLDSRRLSGTELMGLEDLAGVLADLSGDFRPARAPSTGDVSDEPELSSRPEPPLPPADPAHPAEPPSRQDSAADQAAAAEDAPAATDPDGPIESDPDLPGSLCQADGGSEGPEQVGPGALLSPEEIAALLGHDR
jgi:hypothetical protein